MEILRYLTFELFNTLATFIGNRVLKIVSLGKIEFGPSKHWLNTISGFLGWVCLLVVAGAVIWFLKTSLGSEQV